MRPKRKPSFGDREFRPTKSRRTIGNSSSSEDESNDDGSCESKQDEDGEEHGTDALREDTDEETSESTDPEQDDLESEPDSEADSEDGSDQQDTDNDDESANQHDSDEHERETPRPATGAKNIPTNWSPSARTTATSRNDKTEDEQEVIDLTNTSKRLSEDLENANDAGNDEEEDEEEEQLHDVHLAENSHVDALEIADPSITLNPSAFRPLPSDWNHISQWQSRRYTQYSQHVDLSSVAAVARSTTYIFDIPTPSEVFRDAANMFPMPKEQSKFRQQASLVNMDSSSKVVEEKEPTLLETIENQEDEVDSREDKLLEDEGSSVSKESLSLASKTDGEFDSDLEEDDESERDDVSSESEDAPEDRIIENHHGRYLVVGGAYPDGHPRSPRWQSARLTAAYLIEQWEAKQ